MPPKAPPNDWVSTPPVTAEGFSFANNEFFAEASNHNFHRRASPADVQVHFSGGSDKDHPAHWFEAQLKHYGLPVSKTKSVARMRLLDASNAGKLVVPPELVKLEGKLKKEWGKNDREAKKKIKEGGSSPAAGSKRKADNLSSSTTKKNKTDTATPTAPKKSAASAAKPKATPEKATTSTKPKQTARAAPGTLSQAPIDTGASSTPAKRPKQTARCNRGGHKQTSSRPIPEAAREAASSADETSPPRYRTKQTARCNRGGHSQGPSRAAAATGSAPAQTSRPKQTARRGRSFGMQAHSARAGSPSVKSESPVSPSDRSDSPGSPSDRSDNSGSPQDGPMDVDLPALGYLNGNYDVISPYVTEQWPYHGSDFEMVLTLSGREMWASFDLGIISGVMFFPERPWHASEDRVPFKWRGRETEGPISCSDHNGGWIRFLGGGYFEGEIDFMSIGFEGTRVSGQGTTSSRSASNLRNEWDGYSEEQYEYERVARWR